MRERWRWESSSRLLVIRGLHRCMFCCAMKRLVMDWRGDFDVEQHERDVYYCSREILCVEHALAHTPLLHGCGTYEMSRSSIAGERYIIWEVEKDIYHVTQKKRTSLHMNDGIFIVGLTRYTITVIVEERIRRRVLERGLLDYYVPALNGYRDAHLVVWCVEG